MEKRESLTARYERVLGRPLPDLDVEDPHAIEASETQANTSRRREQVLNAQRTHRHRTQQYIRELEKEVFRLRDQNDELRKVMDRMQAEMVRMSSAAAQGGNSLSAQEYHLNRQPTMMNTSYRGDVVSQPAPQITINLTNLANVYPIGSCRNNPDEFDPPPFQPSASTSTYQVQFETDESQLHTSETDKQDTLTVQTGINFILTLEAPCLPHVKHAHMGYTTSTTPKELTYNSGPGHLLCASAMLTHQHHDRVDLESTPFMMPDLDVERLLEASGRLKLDGEVTPVQIWERIKEVSRRGRSVGVDEVDELMRRFEQYVYCNSFGAVVEKGTVEAVLMEWLGVSVW